MAWLENFPTSCRTVNKMHTGIFSRLEFVDCGKDSEDHLILISLKRKLNVYFSSQGAEGDYSRYYLLITPIFNHCFYPTRITTFGDTSITYITPTDVINDCSFSALGIKVWEFECLKLEVEMLSLSLKGCSLLWRVFEWVGFELWLVYHIEPSTQYIGNPLCRSVWQCGWEKLISLC